MHVPPVEIPMSLHSNGVLTPPVAGLGGLDEWVEMLWNQYGAVASNGRVECGRYTMRACFAAGLGLLLSVIAVSWAGGNATTAPATQPAGDSASLVLDGIERALKRVAALTAQHPAIAGVGDTRPQPVGDPACAPRQFQWDFANNATWWGMKYYPEPTAIDASKPFCRISLNLWTDSDPNLVGQPAFNQRAYVIGGKTWEGGLYVWSNDAELVKKVNDIVAEELTGATTRPAKASSPATRDGSQPATQADTAVPEAFKSAVRQCGGKMPEVHSNLDVRIVAGAEAIGPTPGTQTGKPKDILVLPVTIINNSALVIRTSLSHEWYGGEWPPTNLYACVEPKDRSEVRARPLELSPAYRAGERGSAQGETVLEPG